MCATPRQPHILIVDDYADALDIWSLYLRSKGYRVSTATDGDSALREVRSGQPDLVVLDLELPGMSGYDVARDLRGDASTKSTPLIAATGYSREREIELAREAGFDSVVVKPCDPENLINEIKRLLDERVPTVVERSA